MAEKAPKIGVAEWLEPNVRRLLAPNPSPMTHWGTNTYVLGKGKVVIVDPGPEIPSHLDAISEAIDREDCVGIVVTHAHRDHSAGAAKLARRLDTPVYAYGPPDAGRSETMSGLAMAGLTGGGEGVDASFLPNEIMRDGDSLPIGDEQLVAIETPGHFAGHLGFLWEGNLLCGDTVMGWASTLISPPDGDLTAFLETCKKLLKLSPGRLFPGHGSVVDAPSARIDWLVAHRNARTAQILSALAEGPAKIPQITSQIYIDTPTALLPAAERNVFAHLIDLVQKSTVRAHSELSPTATFSLEEKST